MNNFVAYPDTEHPSLTGSAAGIRRAMADGRRAVQVFKLSRVDSPKSDDVEFDREILTVRRAWGPAPYVERPFVYVWDAAVGEGGRWVAGPSRIEYVPEDPRLDA